MKIEKKDRCICCMIAGSLAVITTFVVLLAIESHIETWDFVSIIEMLN